MRLAKELGLSPEERAELLPSGKQTIFANRVHWGHLEKYSLDAGRSAIEVAAVSV
jgi:restriction endonuclease Mrr